MIRRKIKRHYIGTHFFHLKAKKTASCAKLQDGLSPNIQITKIFPISASQIPLSCCGTVTRNVYYVVKVAIFCALDIFRLGVNTHDTYFRLNFLIFIVPRSV